MKDGSYKKTEDNKDESYHKTKVDKRRKLAKDGSYYEPRAAGPAPWDQARTRPETGPRAALGWGPGAKVRARPM